MIQQKSNVSHVQFTHAGLERVILLQRNLHCLEEKVSFKLPLQDFFFAMSHCSCEAFPQSAKILLLTVLCHDKLEFSPEHKYN